MLINKVESVICKNNAFPFSFDEWNKCWFKVSKFIKVLCMSVYTAIHVLTLKINTVIIKVKFEDTR